MMSHKRFRKVFIVQPGFDYTPIARLASELKFITTGYELIQDLPGTLPVALVDFRPNEDALVAVGKVNHNLVLGILLGRLSVLEDWNEVTVGVYSKNGSDMNPYEWVQIKMEDFYGKESKAQL